MKHAQGEQFQTKKQLSCPTKYLKKLKPSKRSAEQDKSRKQKNLRLLEQRAY